MTTEFDRTMGHPGEGTLKVLVFGFIHEWWMRPHCVESITRRRWGEMRSLQKRKEEGNSDAEVQSLCVKSSRGVSQLGNERRIRSSSS